MSTWLSQFWNFAFKSAKHWGRGPYTWSVNILAQQDQSLSPAQALGLSSEKSRSISGDGHANRPTREQLPMPPQLCYWSVHCSPDLVFDEAELQYDSDDEEPDLQDREGEDPMDQSTWRDWPAEKLESAYHERLFEGIVTNDFSNIDGSDLPVALPQAFAKQKDASILREESLGFAIMAGNLDLVKRITDRVPLKGGMRINPLHLATSYLHGSKSCCLILEHLLRMGDEVDFSRHRNHLGHNFLDNLMLTVLRSHTSLAPSKIDDSLKDEKRFPGEEVDICGRWDADSECYRQLVSSGIRSVPSSWKHKFCNTSIQSICHSLDMVKNYDPRILVESSGLFVRRCENCGLKMELKTLHLSILIAVKIAESGLPGEDLVGSLATILKLLVLDKDRHIHHVLSNTACHWLPLATYNNSLHSMDLGTAYCRHKEMDAFEFASSVSEEQISSWQEEVRRGWRVIWHVLRIAKEAEARQNEDNEPDGRFRGHGAGFVERRIATLWGALQVEFLTYRRLADLDPWISPNLDLKVKIDSISDIDRYTNIFPGSA